MGKKNTSKNAGPPSWLFFDKIPTESASVPQGKRVNKTTSQNRKSCSLNYTPNTSLLTGEYLKPSDVLDKYQEKIKSKSIIE